MWHQPKAVWAVGFAGDRRSERPTTRSRAIREAELVTVADA